MRAADVCYDMAEAFKEAWSNEDIKAAAKEGPTMYVALTRGLLAALAAAEIVRRDDGGS